MSAHNTGSTRFIPAYAGNARRARRPFGPRPVHPRIRGERCVRHATTCCTYGSSPHTRGTRCGHRYRAWYGRFIPAYAGNAILNENTRLYSAVHPRIRGERFRRSLILLVNCGSSPHTRGTLQAALDQVHRPRFIPAYAGNAATRSRAGAQGTVHPRIRGERYAPGAERARPGGSSPHTRGTHVSCSHLVGKRRFIPAYAGNAGPSQDRPFLPSVHPRIRGERALNLPVAGVCLGSSPHTRGTRDDDGTRSG